MISGEMYWADYAVMIVYMLIVLGIGSLWATPKVLREENEFSWFPIIEVAYLFIGIFITMIPCLLLLKAGPNGQLAFLIYKVKEPVHYFWVTGMLSAFLDNAPTYLTFFNTALESYLKQLNIKDIYIAGVATDLTVEATARDAHDRDYRVYVLSNCCAAASKEEHDKSLKLISKIGSVVSLHQIV